MIDRRIAYIGSMNISKAHLPKAAEGEGWRDTSVRIVNADLTILLEAYEKAWSHQPIKERVREIFRQIKRNPVIRLNYSRHRRRVLYKNLMHIMSKCKYRLWITNAYFVPDNVLLKHLRDAANTGVDVRILLPKTSDVWMMPWASMTFYQNLLQSGVRIFEYLPNFLHAKTVIIDDWVMVGSSNLNYRSLLHDLEVDVNITSPAAKKMVEAQFLNDLSESKEITLQEWKHRPLRQRIMGRLILYLKYLI
jgi:cardiolipin synthase